MQPISLFVGGARPATLLPWSDHRIGTKSDVSPFIKLVDGAFHSLECPFRGSLQIFLIQYRVSSHGFTSDCMDFRNGPLLSIVDLCHIWLFVRELGDYD